MNLLYKSTRSNDVEVTASQAILKGLADDGGLFVPESLPALEADMDTLAGMSYQETAYEVMRQFLTDFTEEELKDCIAKAYDEKFDTKEIAPLVKKDEAYYLELFHGKTIAFKDMALSILPHLLTTSAKKNQVKNEIVILTATSGDTGKAALAGFADVPGTKIIVFYPKNGVSPIQEKQMVTQKGANTFVVGIHGNFDDAQTGVKKIFVNEEICKKLEENGMTFSSANSINWGRLLPQIVYYFSAYCDLLKAGTIKEEGDKINVVVPTGNFGNILAAYYAKKMGLPIHKLICASNSNNVLTEFLKTGVYNRNREFHATISPSMDILISSNLERLLFDVTGHDTEKVAGWMKELSETGRYQVDAETLAAIQEVFAADYCDDKTTEETIAEVYESTHYLCDTHTAVAVNAYEQYLKETKDDTPTVVVSTASPYKFTDSVLKAVSKQYDSDMDEFAKVQQLSKETGTEIPAPIAALESKTVRFQNVCTPQTMSDELLKLLNLQ